MVIILVSTLWYTIRHIAMRITALRIAETA
jgi:hypothetical protein